jgi:hypothetical protein
MKKPSSIIFWDPRGAAPWSQLAAIRHKKQYELMKFANNDFKTHLRRHLQSHCLPSFRHMLHNR